MESSGGACAGGNIGTGLEVDGVLSSVAARQELVGLLVVRGGGSGDGATLSDRPVVGLLVIKIKGAKRASM